MLTLKQAKIWKVKGFDPRKLLAPGTEAIKATVKEKWNYLVRLEKPDIKFFA